MKLCRFGPKGHEKPGIVDAKGIVRDLSSEIDDITGTTISPESLARLARLDTDSLPVVAGNPRFGVPVNGIGSFVAIGLNYIDHAVEIESSIPVEPMVFNKWVSCLGGANDPVVIPSESTKTDWEAELGVVIGLRAHNIPASQAMDHIAGYCVVNDVSERHWQFDRGPTIDKGKGFPTFGPVGPWLVTTDEVANPQGLAIWLEVNGKRMQDGNTGSMIFPVTEIVAYCSQFMTLEPGDIITTGTPAGVGLSQTPPRFLVPGDVVCLGIEKLGQQRQEFVSSQ